MRRAGDPLRRRRARGAVAPSCLPGIPNTRNTLVRRECVWPPGPTVGGRRAGSEVHGDEDDFTRGGGGPVDSGGRRAGREGVMGGKPPVGKLGALHRRVPPPCNIVQYYVIVRRPLPSRGTLEPWFFNFFYGLLYAP